MLMPGFSRSSSDFTFAPSAGTASTKSLVANTTGLSTRSSLASASGSLVLAEAKRSGLTPLRIWAASSSEPAKESSGPRR